MHKKKWPSGPSNQRCRAFMDFFAVHRSNGDPMVKSLFEFDQWAPDISSAVTETAIRSQLLVWLVGVINRGVAG